MKKILKKQRFLSLCLEKSTRIFHILVEMNRQGNIEFFEMSYVPPIVHAG
jgi:hypothetical protein